MMIQLAFNRRRPPVHQINCVQLHTPNNNTAQRHCCDKHPTGWLLAVHALRCKCRVCYFLSDLQLSGIFVCHTDQRQFKMPFRRNGLVAATLALCGATRNTAAAVEIPKPPHFVVTDAPCCSWDNCGTCSSTTPYCESTQDACETQCKGKWCPTGATGASGYDLPNVCDPAAKSAKEVAYACMDCLLYTSPSPRDRG